MLWEADRQRGTDSIKALVQFVVTLRSGVSLKAMGCAIAAVLDSGGLAIARTTVFP